MAGSMLLAVLVLFASGYAALVAWDRTHQPTLPGLDPGTTIPVRSVPSQPGG